jgi:hypothetical protein
MSSTWIGQSRGRGTRREGFLVGFEQPDGLRPPHRQRGPQQQRLVSLRIRPVDRDRATGPRCPRSGRDAPAPAHRQAPLRGSRRILQSPADVLPLFGHLAVVEYDVDAAPGEIQRARPAGPGDLDEARVAALSYLLPRVPLHPGDLQPFELRMAFARTPRRAGRGHGFVRRRPVVAARTRPPHGVSRRLSNAGRNRSRSSPCRALSGPACRRHRDPAAGSRRPGHGAHRRPDRRRPPVRQRRCPHQARTPLSPQVILQRARNCPDTAARRRANPRPADSDIHFPI